jgi:hypothetical protein
MPLVVGIERTPRPKFPLDRRNLSSLTVALPRKIAKKYIFRRRAMVSGLADFLVQRHDIFGVAVQNWMPIAAVMLMAAIIWSVGKIGQAN